MLTPQVAVEPSSRPASSQSNAGEDRSPTETAEDKHEPNPSAEVQYQTNGLSKHMENDTVLVPPMSQNQEQPDSELEDEEVDEAANTRPRTNTVLTGGGYWGSRPPSPSGGDNASETSSVMPPPPSQQNQRPKSRAESKYDNLSYWRARKVTFFKNGDPYFPGIEYRFKPGRDIPNLEALQDKLSVRMDLPRGARYIFSMDGIRILTLDELDDNASYVVSSYKTFKNANYGKKNATTWYSNQNPQPGPSTSSGWGRQSMSRKSSMVDPDMPLASVGAAASKSSSSNRVIRVINNLDHTVQCRVLLNLKTAQPFEEVLEDLGQVLKMSGAKRMYTVAGQEVRSFSQLRNEFSDVDTFYLSSGGGVGSPLRRSRSRGALASNPPVLVESAPDSRAINKRRARSKSRPRALYAAEPDMVRTGSDYTLLEVLKEEPVRLTIRGMRRTFYPPLHHAPPDNSPPDRRLVLDWVHGYRGIDAKKNLWVLPSGELMYYVAAVVVLYDRDEEQQRHYIGHTEDVMCLDLHPSRELVVSGQRGGRTRKTQAHIRIWSTDSLLTLYVLGIGELDSGVSAVAFSQLNGGSYVLAVDGGHEKILSVWQWQWGHLLGKVATLQEEVTGAAFHPLDDNLMITHGKGHLTFWTRRKDGFFERTDIIKPPSRTQITSLQFETEGDVVTADSDGFITVYSVDSEGAYFVRLEFEAHTKGISSLVMLSEGTLLSGGEKDRKIVAWDSLQNYKKIAEAKLAEINGGVRTIYPQRPGRNDGNIYVGTTRNNIMEGSLQRRFNQIIFGHGRQLSALAVHPDDELFATAGQDKNIALWKRNKLLWCTQVTYECVSLTWHPFGVALAIGSAEGYLIVINAESGALITTLRVCGSPLTCIAYNPGGDLVAIGSQNGSVYLMRVSRDGVSYKKSNKMRGTQALTTLDWSTDGNYLQTATLDYDLTFWDVKTLTPEKSPITMKDVKWYSYNATVGYLVSGIWNNRFYPMTSMISAVNRSAAHDLLIAGDVDGYLRLFRYPCTSPKAEYSEEKVYSGQINSARFMFNDRNLVTVGGSDATLMLWEIVDD